MASPAGIFRSLTTTQLAALETSALERITNGERTSMSGVGKSGSKQWQMSPEQVLIEVAFARNPQANRRVEQIIKKTPRCNYC